MVTKVQIQKTMTKPRGRPKRDGGLQAAIDADRFAMSSLEEVSKSSALNVNCIITRKRANLVWHLYASLHYLITPPLAPPPQPQPFNMLPYSVQTPQAFQAAMDAARAQQHGYQGPPPPHQFLVRQDSNTPGTPGMNPMVMDRVKMYTPGYLPRSGQSMKFSFQPPPMAAQFSPYGTPMLGHPGMPPHPGMAMSPGMQFLPGPPGPPPTQAMDRRMQATTPMVMNGPGAYPHPGAVVEDR